MPISREKRARYMRQAGLTERQIKETTGTFTIDPTNAQVTGATEQVLADAAAGVTELAEDCTVISAVYNQVAEQAGKDAREVADQEQVTEDRAILESLFAEEYRFTDPRGNVGGREKTIDAILSGRVHKEGFGKAGFETTSNIFHVHGNGAQAVSIGEFTMRGTGLARNVKTGQTAQRSRSGTYRTSHTYIFRDGRWQLAVSQMTRVPVGRPDDLDWQFIDD